MSYTYRDLLNLLRGNPDLQIDDAYIHSPILGLAQAVPIFKMTERDLQQAVIDECDRRAINDPRYAHIFHPASGELRDKRTAAKLKRMGVRRGLLDLYLIYPNWEGKGGWACELKTGNNRPTPEQKAEMDYLLSVGWTVECIWSDVQKVIDSLERYLG